MLNEKSHVYLQGTRGRRSRPGLWNAVVFDVRMEKLPRHREVLKIDPQDSTKRHGFGWSWTLRVMENDGGILSLIAEKSISSFRLVLVEWLSLES